MNKLMTNTSQDEVINSSFSCLIFLIFSFHIILLTLKYNKLYEPLKNLSALNLVE